MASSESDPKSTAIRSRMRGRFYFRYRADSSTPIPRTSSWRSQRHARDRDHADEELEFHDDGYRNTCDLGLGDTELLSQTDGNVSNDEENGSEEMMNITETDRELDPALLDMSLSDHDHDDDFDLELEDVIVNPEQEQQHHLPTEASNVDHDEGGHDDGKDENNEVKDSMDESLYHGSRLTIGVSVLLIATFIMRHGLSGECVSDLLTLIELHCLSDNMCVTSLRLFNKFMSTIKTPAMVKHYYCEHCSSYFGDRPILPACHVCSKPSSRNGENFLIINPLNSALQSSFSRKGFVENLKYRMERSKENENNIEDVFDGVLYKRHFNSQGFFHGTSQDRLDKEIHLSFQLNTDGVAIFKSNKTSMWPVYLVINELHPKLRYSRRERIFLGVWYGTGKPFFRTFLQPFAESFKELFVDGYRLHADGLGEVLVRGILLSAVMDAPARCTFQDFTQFNGNMGCPFCLSPGEMVCTAGGGHTRAYIYILDTLTGHHDPRTHEETLQFAAEAQRQGKPVGGVKGYSWFLFVPKFNIIDNVAVDYMHGLVLGIMKMFISLWFETCYRHEGFSISKFVKEVDQRLHNISPPNFITRMPRNIESHIKFWKASEYRSFLLFYSLPCLWGILPDEYFQHFLLLNESAFILLSESISEESLLKVERMLKHFCLRIENLYGKRYQTSNMHSLLHYVEKVRLLGPLWANSCFPFEDFNGDIKNLFHGTRGVCQQIVNAICLQQIIPNFEASFTVGSDVHAFYDRLTRKRCCKFTESISVGVSVIGAVKESERWPDLSMAVDQVVRKVYQFSRLFLKGMIIQSKSYWPNIKRNSYTVEFIGLDGQMCYGQVQFFLKCYFMCLNPLLCNDNCPCQIPIFFAVLHKYKLHNLVLSSDTYTNATAGNIVPVQLNSSEETVVNVLSICRQCVWIDIGDEDVGFIGRIPNLHEKD